MMLREIEGQNIILDTHELLFNKLLLMMSCCSSANDASCPWSVGIRVIL
jgi:hypothetical protein